MSRPLVITADESARDAVLRLAAAAGVDADVVTDVAAARRRWHEASMVVVGADLTGALVAARVSRRSGVVLLGDDLDDATVWQRAVELGAEHVAFLPDAQTWLLERFAATLGAGRQGVALGVVGGRGGCGASTMAAALALSAGRLGKSAVLVDADPLGGGIDLLLGAEDLPGPRWPEIARAAERVSAAGLCELLPRASSTPFLSWDRDVRVALRPGTVPAVLGAARRESDVVVVDLPRFVDDASVEVFAAIGTLLLVVPADVRGVASAARVAAAVTPYVADLRAVVRRPTGGGISPDFVADTLGLPLAGRYKAERSVAADAERGLPPAVDGRGHLARLCTALVRDLTARGDEPRASAA